MRPTYGILDLFALVEKLLAPLVDPLRAEFAVKAIDRPRPSTPPQPQPQPAPVPPVVRPAAESTVIPAEPATPIVTRPAVADTLPADVQPAPLFVRKKTGGQWRYHPARADATGPKFRRLTAGKRVRYEPAR